MNLKRLEEKDMIQLKLENSYMRALYLYVILNLYKWETGTENKFSDPLLNGKKFANYNIIIIDMIIILLRIRFRNTGWKL